MWEGHFPKIIYQLAGSQKPNFLLMPPVLEEIHNSKLNNYRGRQEAEGRRQEENCPLFPAATIGSKGLRPPPNFQFGGSFSGGV
jgi:hypothetical protein